MTLGDRLKLIYEALTSGSGGAGGPATIANGADVAEGSTTDAAVSTDANGTVSAKLRGLIVLWVNYLTRFPAALDTSGALPASSPPFSIVLNGSQSRNSSLSGVVTLTPPAGAKYLVMQATVSGKDIRYTLDNSSPSATNGFCLVAKDPPVRIPVAGHTFKFIEEAATATLEYVWEGS